MKQYMLAVHGVEGEPTPRPRSYRPCSRRSTRSTPKLKAAGAWVFGGGLLPPDSATVVGVENGTTTMTVGPFAETKERLGGFWVLQCADLDQALAWAEKCSAACIGPVEVRPFEEEPDT